MDGAFGKVGVEGKEVAGFGSQSLLKTSQTSTFFLVAFEYARKRQEYSEFICKYFHNCGLSTKNFSAALRAVNFYHVREFCRESHCKLWSRF